jgi:frataxin-like iron-binding protein CyaY
MLTGYLEEEQVPGDTEIINHTWKKANKDGSMDRRYNGNYQIPIVKYGQFSISSQTGIDEVYMFSNFGGFMKFAEYFVAHVKKLGSSA